MYSEWTSLSPLIQNGDEQGQSVLKKFNINISKDVTLGIVRHLASNLGITSPAEPSTLTTDGEVFGIYK